MEVSRLQELFDRWLSHAATQAEEQELMQMLADPKFEQERSRLAETSYDNLPDTYIMSEKQGENIFQQIVGNPVRVHRVHFIHRFRWVAAAVLIGLISVTGWLVLNDRSETYLAKKDVMAPARNRATIALGNGQIVYLDSAANGQLAAMDKVQLVKLADGKIAYNGGAGSITYNTITNPRGSNVVDIELTDGSHVWLNAGSSMRYPVPFEKDKRKVEMKGEAYFEVARNKDKPFIVKTATDEIEVLGTHFNINSYTDEPGVRTTLLEGSVKIGALLLKPGEQHLLGRINKVNTEAAVSWVHGYFEFEHADIQTVMRQLSRWYDVDVRYEGNTSKEIFGGEIPRELSLSKALKGVSETGFHYSLRGKTLIIQP